MTNSSKHPSSPYISPNSLSLFLARIYYSIHPFNKIFIQTRAIPRTKRKRSPLLPLAIFTRACISIPRYPLENRFDSSSALDRYTYTYVDLHAVFRIDVSLSILGAAQCAVTQHTITTVETSMPHRVYIRATYVTGTCDERERGVVPLCEEDRGRGLEEEVPRVQRPLPGLSLD